MKEGWDERTALWCYHCHRLVRFGKPGEFIQRYVRSSTEDCPVCHRKAFWETWLHPRYALFVLHHRKLRK